MESFAFYLLKSAVWLAGFALVYILFLRNERYFALNRIYLVSGILFSIVFPFFTWYYTVELPIMQTDSSIEILGSGIRKTSIEEESKVFQFSLLLVYITGILFVVFRTFRQTLPIFRIIKKSKAYQYDSFKLIRSDEYQASFSFISFVFVNPSIDEIETCEIVNHEQEHIRQKHWIDLLLFEILRTVQWFNPIIWLYGRIIRQNHEYLADRYALQRSSSTAVYRGALLNQMFSGSLVSLTNSFNYSLNKKRFNMMKHTIQSPIRKLKLAIIFPVIAGIFYAFSAPEYHYVSAHTDAKDGKTHSYMASINGTSYKTWPTAETPSTIGTISWLNNSIYTAKQLNETLGIKPGDSYSGEKLEDRMYGAVSDLYLDHGYLFFNIEKIESVGDNGTEDLIFKLYEGNRFKIRNIKIEGNDKVPMREIEKLLSIKSGDLFSRRKLNESVRSLCMSGKFDPNGIRPEVLPDLNTQNEKFGKVDLVFHVKEL